MSPLIDLAGEKYEYLTVIERDFNQTSSGTYWKCICKCNTVVSVEASRLKSGKTKSCGCFRREVSKSRGEDLTGKSFGILTVIRKSEEKNEGGYYPWICKCECGTVKGIRASNLKGGTTKSCGCLNDKKRKERKSNFNDLTGNNYGKLTVLYEVPRGSKKDIQWRCLCECGEETTVGGGQLREERTKSCGCLRKEQPNLGKDRTKAILLKVYSGIIGRRKHRNLLNDLTFDEFKTIIYSPCVYCGEKNSNYSMDITNGHLITDTIVYFNGIDRIDNNVGYTLANCVPCCKNCNNAKGEMSLEEFLIWVKRTYEYYIGG